MATGEPNILAVLVKIEQQHVKLGEGLAEIRALLEAEPTPKQLANRALQYFFNHWVRKFPNQKPVIDGAKDMGRFLRLIKQLGAEETAARVKRYFHRDDKFIVDAHYSLSVFFAKVNELLPDESDARNVAPPPAGCAHTPRCTSDAQHTVRTREDRIKGAR